jgi:hypothetical protein
MRLSWKLKAAGLTAGLLLGLAPIASAAPQSTPPQSAPPQAAAPQPAPPQYQYAQPGPVFAGGYYPVGGYYGYPASWGYPWGVYYGPVAGFVKFQTHDKAAKEDLVYVDGGYAGTIGKLKKFPLRPGDHRIELRSPDGHKQVYKQHVQVILGKTVKIPVG